MTVIFAVRVYPNMVTLPPINHCHTPIDEALALTIYSAAEGGAAGSLHNALSSTIPYLCTDA